MTVQPTSSIAQALQDCSEYLRLQGKVAALDVRKSQTDFYQKIITGMADPAAPVYDATGKVVTQPPPTIDVTT